MKSLEGKKDFTLINHHSVEIILSLEKKSRISKKSDLTKFLFKTSVLLEFMSLVKDEISTRLPKESFELNCYFDIFPKYICL